MQQGLLGSADLQIDGAKGGACACSKDLLVGLIRLMLQGGFDPRHELPHLLVAPFALLPGGLCDGVEQVERRGEQPGARARAPADQAAPAPSAPSSPPLHAPRTARPSAPSAALPWRSKRRQAHG